MTPSALKSARRRLRLSCRGLAAAVGSTARTVRRWEAGSLAVPSPAAERVYQMLAMEPDYSRSGIFVHHNCSRCGDGARPCVQGGPHLCEFPHARNE